MVIVRSATSRSRMTALSWILTGLVGIGALAACSGTAGSSVELDGVPRTGGMLRLAGSHDVDHLDPAAGSSTSAALLLRATSRQLVSYPAASGESTTQDPVPDLAEALPLPAAGRTVYTFRLRRGASWDTTPSRQIVAADVERGFRRLCNPVSSGGMPAYLPGLVAGMARYCAGFAQVPPDVEAIRRYVEANRIPGVRALDELTVRFELTRPAGDVLHILAMPFASPMPVEALDHLPDSPAFRQHLVSSGPYSITRYAAGRGFTLERNLAWRPETDPIRKAYVDRIEITLGLDAQSVQRRIEAGGAELSFDTDVPAGDVARLAATKDPKLVFAEGGAGERYLAVRLASANENHAMANLRVRQALNYAVDKHALVTALGGRQLWLPRDQILPPSTRGYEQFNLYPTPEHRGDPGTARQLLDDAGYPHGLDVTLTYPPGGAGRRLAGILRDQFAKAGITLLLSPRQEDGSSGRIERSPAAGASGEWDLALVEATPAPPGVTGRAVFAQLLADSEPGAGTGIDRLVEQALTEPSRQEAAASWTRADKRAMQLAFRVPLALGHSPRYQGEGVNGWAVSSEFPRGDLTGVWLQARDHG